MLDEGESVTHRFDCNTLGPVPVASGYGSRTLTHSAVHVLDTSKDHASALSSLYEKIHTQNDDNGLWELSETEVGYFKIPPFTGSNLRLVKDGVLQRQNPIMVEANKQGAMPKTCHFTLRKLMHLSSLRKLINFITKINTDHYEI